MNKMLLASNGRQCGCWMHADRDSNWERSRAVAIPNRESCSLHFNWNQWTIAGISPKFCHRPPQMMPIEWCKCNGIIFMIPSSEKMWLSSMIILSIFLRYKYRQLIIGQVRQPLFLHGHSSTDWWMYFVSAIICIRIIIIIKGKCRCLVGDVSF